MSEGDGERARKTAGGLNAQDQRIWEEGGPLAGTVSCPQGHVGTHTPTHPHTRPTYLCPGPRSSHSKGCSCCRRCSSCCC